MSTANTYATELYLRNQAYATNVTLFQNGTLFNGTGSVVPYYNIWAGRTTGFSIFLRVAPRHVNGQVFYQAVDPAADNEIVLAVGINNASRPYVYYRNAISPPSFQTYVRTTPMTAAAVVSLHLACGPALSFCMVS
jgi:hypothetical protein